MVRRNLVWRNLQEMESSRHPARRKVAIPVLPPRVPTPMPPPNNNNAPRSSSRTREQNTKVHPASVGLDIPKLISKDPYKLLDNDVKTAWINPRLISKIDMNFITGSDYNRKPNPDLRNMNGYNNHNFSSYHHQQQQKQGCGRTHEREWEPNVVNGRAKQLRVVPVPTLTSQEKEDAKREKLLQSSSRSQEHAHSKAHHMEQHHHHNNNHQHRSHNKSSTNQSKNKNVHQPHAKIINGAQRAASSAPLEMKGLVGYQSKVVDYVGDGFVGQNNPSVYGMYAETRFAFSVNGIPENPAQASAAAAFFARAAQKLNLTSSPHRRKRHNSEDLEPTGFCGALQRSPPSVPPALLRRIGVKEVTGVGKVKVMLRVSTPPGSSSPDSGCPNFFNLDKRKKQVTLVDPTTCGNAAAPEDRRVGVAAPKMFAFDAIFSQDDSQTEVCSSALTDVIHAVINGNDGCLFCFGHAGLGKSHTMLGMPDNANSLGVMPCAISWLFRGINEQKQKTGARFSVRVSAVEISGASNQVKDLLAGYSNDSEQSPGVYLRDDSLLGNQPPHCELRVPSAERAAHYLDVALEGRTPGTENRDSHLLFTLHVYQYSVAGKGGVAGGRSRLHLFDLGNSERGKSSGGIPLSGLGNILLAIFNGQKHLPYKDHKLTHLLKDSLNSLTCHAAMIAHVSPYAQNYSDTLTTVQLASRIHRMRRRRIKFVSAGVGNGSGSSGEEAARTTSSEPDPSSSDLSADTVIYVGPADEATDGEHPPVYIPSLNSGDNRCVMSKALRGSTVEQRAPKLFQTSHHRSPIKQCKTSPAHSNGSPSKSKPNQESTKTAVNGGGGSDEQWIDGPRISKSKVAEARYLMKETHVKKVETWIDGPMHADAYGYMDNHKKNMIRKWVEHQTSQIQRRSKSGSPKEMTQFKTCEEDAPGKCDVEESVVRTGLRQSSSKTSHAIPEDEPREDDEEDPVEIPPALPLIQPLTSREVSLESLERIMSISLRDLDDNSEDEILEIIEVEEPLEPVPTQDCCLQVTEEDIAYCMGVLENPLPEVDQDPLDHPLRILSQENLTVVSTFTDSMSVFTDLERIFPRQKYVSPYKKLEETSTKFDQLARLHELYTNRLAKANPVQKPPMTRCESLTLTDMLYGLETSSIYSEPAYIPTEEKFCKNCKVNMSRPATAQNWYEDHDLKPSPAKFERYCHADNLSNLRHPDGASNPNLREETERVVSRPLTPPNSLPSTERINRKIMNFDSGLTSIKFQQNKQSDEYDSGHDSTPRTSKHSPAAISRRAESGYDSVVRDSESSSIDSETSRLSHLHNRRGKCKHKHDKSFCSWFLHPFTCKYIHESPETHF